MQIICKLMLFHRGCEMFLYIGSLAVVLPKGSSVRLCQLLPKKLQERFPAIETAFFCTMLVLVSAVDS